MDYLQKGYVDPFGRGDHSLVVQHHAKGLWVESVRVRGGGLLRVLDLQLDPVAAPYRRSGAAAAFRHGAGSPARALAPGGPRTTLIAGGSEWRSRSRASSGGAPACACGTVDIFGLPQGGSLFVNWRAKAVRPLVLAGVVATGAERFCEQRAVGLPICAPLL
eukprot:64865-Prymnesium_polylepis.1